MKNIILATTLLIAASCGEVIKDKKTTVVDSRLEELLAQMTLKEKVGQMNQYSAGTNLTGPEGSQDGRYDRFVKGEVGSVLNVLGAEETRKLQKLVVENSRLGIPLIFSYDVIHGYKTIFPLPLAESASWDLALMEKTARIAALETSASGIHWTFAPMVDIMRDARWGRVMEGSGEDPYMASQIADARIRGFQGDDLSDVSTIAACAKHFAGYGFAESGKDYNAVNLGVNMLHNVVLPPFKQSIESGAATFMNAFNDIDGVPSTANNYLLRDLLFDKWGFNGVVVSDWNSIGELVNHGVAKDEREASILAANAGSHIDMEADAYIENLEQLVNDGKVKESVIDDAVRRILDLKFKLGLFDDPYKYSDIEREKKIVGSEDFVATAREMAVKSIVLLKNEGNLLPLKDVRKIGIIGPLAKDKDAPLGNWRAQAVTNSAVSLFEGVQNSVKSSSEMKSSVELSYAKGVNLSIGPNDFAHELVIEENDRSGFAEAIRVARTSDVVIMVLGEPAYMSGEARSRADIGLPGLQLELLKEVYKVNKKVVLVLMNGRPLTIPWEAENIPAIVEAWHLGSEAGNAIADVLSGKVNPSGKLPMTFPRAVGQLPIYYNKLNTGRPESGLIFYEHHMDVDRSPLYPFGFGLSYTTFDYKNLTVTSEGEKVIAHVTVTNSGNMDGEEIVQLYIRDLVATTSRPVLELKSFEKITLKSGASKRVKFELTKEDLSFYNQFGDLIFEPGEFEISIGASSADLMTEKIEVN